MKKIIQIILIGFFFTQCFNAQKSSSNEDAMAIFLANPTHFQVSGNLQNTSPMANARVYFSKSTSGILPAIRSMFSVNSSSQRSPLFSTSTQTDENGNFSVILAIGEYSAIVTGLDNRSSAFKIKIEAEDFSLTKAGRAVITFEDGTVQVLILNVVAAPNAVENAAVSFVCGYNPLGDTAAPELVSVVLSSESLDLTSGTGTVTIKASITEGFEGSSNAKRASGINYVTAKLYSPNKIAGAGGYSTYATLTLNTTSGLYEGDITLTNFVENGLWKVGLIETRDNAGNERSYIFDSTVSESNYTFNACGQKLDSLVLAPDLTVTGSSPDDAAPTISTPILKSEITGGPTQDPISGDIDLSSSTSTPKEVKITITVDATDTGGTGNTSGVAYMDVRLQSFSWWDTNSNYLGNSIYVRLNLISGDTTTGTYSGTATIRSYAEGNSVADGVWKLGGIWVTDLAGNSLWTDRNTLNQSFTLTNASTSATADFYAPELLSISLDKSQVGFDESFSISADVADTTSVTTSTDQTVSSVVADPNAVASGVSSVYVVFYSPLRLLDGTLGVTKSVSLTFNPSTNKFEGNLNFPTLNNEEGGTWKIGWIEVKDNAGNCRVYNLTEGYNYYTYLTFSKTSGSITNTFNVTTI